MNLARLPSVPPPDAGDRLPHDRAVWRTMHLPSAGEMVSKLQVSVDRNGWIEQTLADQVNWLAVSRWRFGWAPEGNSR